MAGGRPSKFTKKLADDICEELAQGKSLRTVCKDEKMPSMSAVFKWLREDEEFAKQYARAKEESADAMTEELQDLGDLAISLAQTNERGGSALVQAVKLKADNIKWAASKLKPKKYGERVDVTTDGEAIKGNTIILKRFDAPANDADGQ